MTDYKQLAKELYETLNEVTDYIDYDEMPRSISQKIDVVTSKYEQETTRGTGRTTALYMKAIAEALANPGKTVDFIDHYPHNWQCAHHHADMLAMIIEKLGYDIVVQTKGKAQVYLYNKFVK